MNETIKEKWLKALRSGKYKQGTGRLFGKYEKNKKEFCCLGVLCDLYAKEHDVKWEVEDIQNHIMRLGNSTDLGQGEGIKTLSKEVQKWAGLKDCNPSVLAVTPQDYIRKTLAEHNDTGKTFKEIAAIIENYL